MPKTLVSKFSDKGVLERISSIQNRVLKRMLSAKRLNEMNSIAETLPNVSTDPSFRVNELLEILGSDLMDLSAAHALNRNVQLSWIIHLKELSQDKNLTPNVASLVVDAMNQTQAKVKSKRKKGTDIEKAHYQYAFELLSKDE